MTVRRAEPLGGTMEHRAADAAWSVASHSRFELAPPRRFLLPALLLLLTEEPGYGYNLAKGLEELHFGRVDRPSVYRALAQLESDGLVESWAGAAKAGQARRVYGLTDRGERALRAWMGVVKQERDCLDEVLRRYVATGTIDAALAEAEGGWGTVTGQAWSPVSSTPGSSVAAPASAPRSAPSAGPGDGSPEPSAEPSTRAMTDGPLGHPPVADLPGLPTRFHVVPDRSVVLIEVRSTVGPITFGAVGVTGTHRRRGARRGRAPGEPSLGPSRGRGHAAALGQRRLRRRADATHRRPPPSRRRPRPARLHGRRRSPPLPHRRRGDLPRVDPPARGHGRADLHVRGQAGRVRGTGLRHPGLRHRVADRADAKDLPGRAGAAPGRGRSGARRIEG